MADPLSRLWRNLMVASVAAAAVACAGCGSGGPKSASSARSTNASASPAPSRSSYVRQVDTICRATSANRSLIATTGAIERVNKSKLSVQQAAVKLAPLWEREARQQRAYNQQIAAVAQPSADRARLAQIAAVREGLVTTDQSIAAMFRKSPGAAAYELLGKELARLGTRLSALDRAYGFKACGAE